MDDKQVQEITGLFGEMKAGYAKLGEEIAQYGKGNGETLEKLAKQQDELSKIREAQEKARADADQFAATMREQVGALGSGKRQDQKSLGQLVVESPDFLAAKNAGGRFAVGMKFQGTMREFERKDITGVSLLMPQALTDIIGAVPILPYGVRQLVPQGRTTAGAVEYIRETSATNNAAPVAEGAAKPKSDKVFTVVNTPVTTIAHYFKISKQCFDDLPAMVSMIEAQGVQMLKFKEDNQLLNGNGTPPNLTGFMQVAAAAPAGVAGGGLVDTLGPAVFDLAAKGYMPDGAVVNPADWGTMAMMKNSQGNYLFVNPLSYTVGGNLWGVKVVTSANMAAGSFLVGAFKGNSLIVDREEVNVSVANQNEDDFIRNMITILIEERLALLIFQTTAFEKGVLVPAV